MTAIVEIDNGTYKIRGRDTSMTGMRFELVEGYKVGADNIGYVTVNGGSAQPPNSGIPDRKIRIRCDGTDAYRVIAGAISSQPVGDKSLEQIKIDDSAVAHISDEEIIEKTRARFQILTDMTKAVKEGSVRAMIVSGPPGVG